MSKIVLTRARRMSSDNINQSALEKCNEADQYLLSNTKKENPNLDEIKKALILYQEAAQEDSNLIQPYLGIAYIAQSSGDFKLAIGLLNKAYQLQPSNIKVKEMLDGFKKELVVKKKLRTLKTPSEVKNPEAKKIPPKKVEFNLGFIDKPKGKK